MAIVRLIRVSAQEVLRAAKAKSIGAIEACGPLAPLFVNLIAGATWFYFSVLL